MLYEKITKYKKNIISVFVIFFVIGGYFAFTYIQNNLLFRPHGTINIISIPFKVEVADGSWTRIVDTQPVDGTALAFDPGTRKIKFSAKGFVATTQEVSIEDGKNQTVYIYLEPNEQWAEDDINNETKYGYRREAMATDAIDTGSQKIAKDSPIVNNLPILEKWYSIYACSSSQELAVPEGKIGICITLDLDNDVQRANALKEITDLGYKLSDYTILINEQVYTPPTS